MRPVPHPRGDRDAAAPPAPHQPPHGPPPQQHWGSPPRPPKRTSPAVIVLAVVGSVLALGLVVAGAAALLGSGEEKPTADPTAATTTAPTRWPQPPLQRASHRCPTKRSGTPTSPTSTPSPNSSWTATKSKPSTGVAISAPASPKDSMTRSSSTWSSNGSRLHPAGRLRQIHRHADPARDAKAPLPDLLIVTARCERPEEPASARRSPMTRVRNRSQSPTPTARASAQCPTRSTRRLPEPSSAVQLAPKLTPSSSLPPRRQRPDVSWTSVLLIAAADPIFSGCDRTAPANCLLRRPTLLTVRRSHRLRAATRPVHVISRPEPRGSRLLV